MKRKNLILLVICLFLSLAFVRKERVFVKYVYDGDTILLETGQRVRYAGIDAPELDHEGNKNEFMAREAKEFNEELVMGKPIRLELDKKKRDRYGRLLAYVYIESGLMVNGMLVRKGLAHVLADRPNLKHFKQLLRMQRIAMTEGLGIWKNQPIKIEEYYIASKKSFRFHRPSCPFGRRIWPKNRLVFKDRKSAFWNGFSPCKKCRP
ncbi:MAG: thermonuclease family protein [Deltaproteobacteria bacterium]|nr:thermonuclease family protein [Deltaproteobacteria bacterium]